MKFRCDRDVLADALQTVQRGVSSRPGIPALTGVLLEAGDDGRLTLTTTDLEMSARLTVQVDVVEAGVALIPARLLSDTVKSLSPAPVEVETDEEQAHLRCAAYEGTLRLLPHDDFPRLQEPSGAAIAVPARTFADGVSQVIPAASRDEARPVLTGVLVEVGPDGAAMVTTDSYRLAIRKLEIAGPQETKVVVPWRALSEAGRAADASSGGQVAAPAAGGDGEGEPSPSVSATAIKDVEVVLDDSQVAFRVGDLTLTSRLIEGEFPPYGSLIPESSESRLDADRQQLLEAVRRVGLLARDTQPVQMTFESGGVRLSSDSPDLGHAEELVDANFDGESLTVAFNPQYFIDGLTACKGERITLDVRDGLKPGVLHGSDEGFTYLVMPVRLPAAVV